MKKMKKLSGRFLMKELNYVIKHLNYDMKDLKVRYQMLHRFFGKMGLFQDLKREKLLINSLNCLISISYSGKNTLSGDLR